MEFAVYVHVPYCRVQCPYCTFYTVRRPESDAVPSRFVAAILHEWRRRVVPRLERGDRLATLYFGGGTPSDLPLAAVESMLAAFGAALPGGIAALDESTFECNPESTTPELLDVLQRHGVSRPSLGVQALDAEGLRRLGRGASLEDNRAAIARIRERFGNWNADLILGIPGSHAARLGAALEELAAAGAPHLSFYCLEMPRERARRLGDPGTPASEALKADLYLEAASWIEAHGYEHYEISNAARPGFRAVHNTSYWQGREYVGLGPGAASFESGVRRANVPDQRRYVEALEGDADPPATLEVLTARMRRDEAVLLGLRQEKGLDLGQHAVGVPLLLDLETSGLARVESGRLRLTKRGWLLSDSIALQLVTA